MANHAALPPSPQAANSTPHAHPPRHLPQEKALCHRGSSDCGGTDRDHRPPPLSLRPLPQLSSDRSHQGQAPVA